jgi:hypothetical protein
MSRIARRIVGTVVAVVAVVAGTVALGAPAQADVSASIAWYDGPDYAVIQLDQAALEGVLNYSDGLEYGVDDLANQITDYINGKRLDRHYDTGLAHGDFLRFEIDCVHHRTRNPVQIMVYADLSYGCGTYGPEV